MFLSLAMSPSILGLDASKKESGECQGFQKYHVLWAPVVDRESRFMSAPDYYLASGIFLVH